MNLNINSNVMIFTGNSNIELSNSISKKLNIPIGKARVARFSDREFDIEILEHVRGKNTIIIQSTNEPGCEYLMELLAIADALRRASALSITAIFPYFGFARQDRRVRSARTPITAKIVADMLSVVGIDRILTIDLHADQIQGFFDMPVDNLYSTSLMLSDIKSKDFENISIVSPDIGGVVRARAFSKHIPNSNFAIIDKRRHKANTSEVMNIIGEVNGCDCIVVDDIIDTGGTLCTAAKFIKEMGAKSVRAYITHPVLSGNAILNIRNSDINEVVVSNTIKLNFENTSSSKIRQIDISKLLSDAIKCIISSDSLSKLYI